MQKKFFVCILFFLLIVVQLFFIHNYFTEHFTTSINIVGNSLTDVLNDLNISYNNNSIIEYRSNLSGFYFCVEEYVKWYDFDVIRNSGYEDEKKLFFILHNHFENKYNAKYKTIIIIFAILILIIILIFIINLVKIHKKMLKKQIEHSRTIL